MSCGVKISAPGHNLAVVLTRRRGAIVPPCLGPEYNSPADIAAAVSVQDVTLPSDTSDAALASCEIQCHQVSVFSHTRHTRYVHVYFHAHPSEPESFVDGAHERPDSVVKVVFRRGNALKGGYQQNILETFRGYALPNHTGLSGTGLDTLQSHT